MDLEALKHEISEAIEAHGLNPLGYFWLLTGSKNTNLDFSTQNSICNDLKKEPWHNLDLTEYILWAISDNGEYLWYNGEQVVAMNPRDQVFVSTTATPKSFIELVRLGKATALFPTELVQN